MNDKNRHRAGILQLVVFLFLVGSMIAALFEPINWNFWVRVGTLLIYCAIQLAMAYYWSGKKQLIEINYTLFNAIWSQWYGWQIDMPFDFETNHQEKTEWIEKNISGRWIKRWNGYIFFRKSDAMTFKLIWG